VAAIWSACAFVTFHKERAFTHAQSSCSAKRINPVQFEITELTRQSVAAWIDLEPRFRRLPVPKQGNKVAASFYTAVRTHRCELGIVSIGLDPATYGTHTMRRTKATLIYRRTKNLQATQLLLGHTKLESTVRYLGIEVDDALEMAEQTET